MIRGDRIYFFQDGYPRAVARIEADDSWEIQFLTREQSDEVVAAGQNRFDEWIRAYALAISTLGPDSR